MWWLIALWHLFGEVVIWYATLLYKIHLDLAIVMVQSLRAVQYRACHVIIELHLDVFRGWGSCYAAPIRFVNICNLGNGWVRDSSLQMDGCEVRPYK
jgi:hypothetical protein